MNSLVLFALLSPLSPEPIGFLGSSLSSFSCCRSTNDITSYKQTRLYQWFLQGLIPDEFHMMLDEAYGSIGGNQHLTPFTRHQLRKARDSNHPQYLKMKAFNNALSSQRITIERAFGIMIRKWAILQMPLEHSLAMNVKIVTVCAKLHNYCVLEWKAKGKRAEEILAIEANVAQYVDAGIFMGWDAAHLEDPNAEQYDNEQLALLYGNHLPNGVAATRVVSQRKVQVLETLYQLGFHFDPSLRDVHDD